MGKMRRLKRMLSIIMTVALLTTSVLSFPVVSYAEENAGKEDPVITESEAAVTEDTADLQTEDQLSAEAVPETETEDQLNAETAPESEAESEDAAEVETTDEDAAEDPAEESSEEALTEEESEDALEGQIAPVQTPTVLQAVKEAQSGCQALPPTVKSLSCSTTTNEQGNWTFSGVFTPVAGTEEYELHFGAMEGDGAIYEKGIFTLPLSALTASGDDVSFAIAPYWYSSYVPVAGETVYVALEAYVETTTSDGKKMLSTGWQKLNEMTIGGEPASDKNKLTVRFVNQNNMSIAPAHIEFLTEGESYSVVVPAVEGYVCQYASDKVSGTMADEDIAVNVPYQGNEVALSIAYNYSNGSQAHDPVNATLRVGDSYRYPSPAIDLYKATPEVVEGYATAADVEDGINVQVVYAKDKYILEVQYLLWDGEQNDQTVRDTETKWVEADTSYKVEFLSLDGYSRANDQGEFLAAEEDQKIYKEGVMPSSKLIIKFYYIMGYTKISLSFVDEDGNEIMAGGYVKDQRKDRDFVLEAPVDPTGTKELRDSLFDGRYVRISRYDFKDQETYTHTFKYYKKYKDTIHYRYADPSKGEEEVFPDDVYNRYGTDYMMVPEKNGYVSSRFQVRVKDEDKKKDSETTVYYAPYTMEKGRAVSEGVPYKVFVNDSGRDPFNPTDRYDITLSPLWQWDIDRDEDQVWGSAGWGGSVDVYIDGKFYQTVTTTVSNYPETGEFKHLRGITFPINTGSDLIPASGKFTLTTYEKRDSVYVKTDFDVDIGWAMGATIPSDRFVALSSAVTKDTANSTTSQTVFNWSVDSANYTVGKGALKEYTGTVVDNGAGTFSSQKDDEGKTVYTTTLGDDGCFEPTTRSFEFYASMGYQQAEGFPTENKWVKATGSDKLCRQSEDEQKYSTRSQSANISYAGYDSYHRYVNFNAKWSATGRVHEVWPAHQALENEVEAVEGYTYAGVEASGVVVNAATGKVIGTAAVTKYPTNDTTCEATISISPYQILKNYAETGSGSLEYKVYFRTNGFQVVETTDEGTELIGKPQNSMDVNYTWHPEGNSAGGYWTNSLGGDGTNRGWTSVAMDDWTVISGSYSFDCSLVNNGSFYPNDCTIDRDGSFSLAWELGSMGSKIRSNSGRADFVNKLYASETNIVKAADGLSGQGVYNGLKNAGYVGNESDWEGCPISSAWHTSGVGKLDEIDDSFQLSGKFLKGGHQSDFDKYQSFTGGATANVLVNMAGYYADENKTNGEGEVTQYGKIHFFMGSVRGNVEVSGKRTLPVVSNIKVTKDDVKVITETNKDPRITLDLAWTHTITAAEDLDEIRIDPQGTADTDELSAESAESVGEHPLADKDMAIEITPIGYEDANGRSLLYDNTDCIESFEKTDSGCKLKVKDLRYMDKTRLPDGFDVQIKYLYADENDPYGGSTTIKTFNHRIWLKKDKAQSDVFFQIDDDGNALVRVSSTEKLGSLKVDMYSNSGQIVKKGTLTGYSGNEALYQYNDDIKGAWLETDTWYERSKAQWFKLDVKNVSKENLAKYYVIVHGYDYDRNPFDEDEKHYATAENFVTIERSSVNNGVFRIAYKLNLPEEDMGSDVYDATESSFTITSQTGKPDYVIEKEMELARGYLTACNTREFSHSEEAKDNKNSTALIYFGEEKATNLLGDDLCAAVTVSTPRYMKTKASLRLKSDTVTIEEQPLLTLSSANVDMMGNVRLSGTFDPGTFTISWGSSLKFNIICPDGYVWTNTISRTDSNFTYNNTAGTFAYNGKLFDIIRGAKAMEHYSIKDFAKLKGTAFKASVSVDLSNGKLDSAQIPMVFGGRLKATANMITSVTYNGTGYLKASIPSGWLEYGTQIDGLVDQAIDGNQGLLIVSDDNFSIAFGPSALASLDDADDLVLNICNLTASLPDNVKKSGLSVAGAYDFAMSSPFTGQVEVGLPTGTVPSGKSVAVYYVDGNGNKEAMSAKVVTQGGYSRAVYTTTHNSVYAVVYEGGSNPSGGGGSNPSNPSGQTTDTTPAKGDVVTDTSSNATVVILSPEAKTVEYKATTSKSKTVTVPDTVKVNGKTYKVTTVKADAFKGSKVTKVTLGKNVKKLSAKAFNKSNVKTVVVKSKNLSKKSVKNAFKGSKAKKITLKVNLGSKKENKKFIKKYKKFFTKKNVGIKVVVK